MPKENAIAVLVTVFGIDAKDAAAMVPEPQEPPAQQGGGLADLFGGQNGGNINSNDTGGTDGGNNPVDTGTAFSEDAADRPIVDTADQITDKARPLIEAAIAPWLTTIQNFVDQASSLEEIRDGLIHLYPELDDTAFAEAMGQAMLLADLAGREEVLGDDADVAFAEAIEAALNGTLDFAAKKTSGKKPNCNPAKSHFCQTENGKGSCVPLSKKCQFDPAGVQQSASAYVAPKTTKKKPTVPAPTVPAPTVSTNDKELQAKRTALVNKFGQKLLDDAETNVKTLLNDAGVFIKVPSSEVMTFVLGDKFKTAHELGGRPGAPPPGAADDYLNARARVEKKVLGVDTQTNGSDRPKYGYLGSADLNSAEHLDVSGAYGNITVEFRPEVKARSTFTGADSFKSGIASKPDAPNAASLVSVTSRGIDQAVDFKHGAQLGAAAKAKSLSELAEKLAPQGNAYLETQIHGALGPKDVKALHFRPTGYHDSPSPEVVRLAKEHGIDIYINGKLTPYDKVKPLTPPKSISDLSTAIESGNIERLQNVYARLEVDLKTQQTKAPNKFGGAHPMQNLLAEKAGFAGKPKVVDASEFEKLAASGQVVMYRGVSGDGSKSGSKIQEQFLSGDYHSGSGVYGNGNYFAHGSNTRNGVIQNGSASDKLDAQAKSVAIEYASRGFKQDPKIIRVALSEDAKIATSEQVIGLQRNFAKKIDAEIEVRRQRALDRAPKITQKNADTINAEIDAMDSSFKLKFSKEKIQSSYTGSFGVREIMGGTFVQNGKNKRPEVLNSALRKFGKVDTIIYQLTGPGGTPSIHLTDAPVNLQKYMQEKYKDQIPVNYKNNGLNWIKFDSVDAMNAAIEESTKELTIIERHGALGKRKAGDPPKEGYTAANASAKVLEDFKDKLKISSDDTKEAVSSTFAIAMGIDAISVSATSGKSDERSQYINVLNRSKLIADGTIYTPSQIKKAKRP